MKVYEREIRNWESNFLRMFMGHEGDIWNRYSIFKGILVYEGEIQNRNSSDIGE